MSSWRLCSFLFYCFILMKKKLQGPNVYLDVRTSYNVLKEQIVSLQIKQSMWPCCEPHLLSWWLCSAHLQTFMALCRTHMSSLCVCVGWGFLPIRWVAGRGESLSPSQGPPLLCSSGSAWNGGEALRGRSGSYDEATSAGLQTNISCVWRGCTVCSGCSSCDEF